LVIQQFLMNYVATVQQDWVDHLEWAEFCYNNSKHSTTRSTPFQMVTGKSPIIPWFGQHMDNPRVMQVRKCQWSHNLMKKDDAFGKWQRPTWKRCTKGTKILRTSPDERWSFKKGTKCGWTLRIFSC
jgi:hypothetical protein